ncbi:MAG: helix-turn-helix domain-containing protein [Thermoanaerobaculia bacterium]
MKVERESSDERILAELGSRLEQLRLQRGITQAVLAREAGIGKRTLERMEDGGGAQIVSLIRVLRALGLLERLDLLAPEALPSPIALARLQGRRRQRATRKRDVSPAAAWTWNERE